MEAGLSDDRSVGGNRRDTLRHNLLGMELEMKKLVCIVLVVGLFSGCAWFCKVDIPEVKATLSDGIAKIQGDYNQWVQLKELLLGQLAMTPNDPVLQTRLTDVVNYLGLADQALVIALPVIKALQDGICPPVVVAADAEAKTNEANANEPDAEATKVLIPGSYLK